jgi:hypothetical protein
MIDQDLLPQIVRQALDGEKAAVNLLMSMADWLQLAPGLPLGAAGHIQARFDDYHNWLLTNDEGIIVNLDGVM